MKKILYILLFVPLAMFGQIGNIYYFNSCGSGGDSGPSQTQVNESYLESNLEGLVISDNGIQLWIVPESSFYRISCHGAQGGGGSLGANNIGDFELFQGDTIKILVGQSGSPMGC